MNGAIINDQRASYATYLRCLRPLNLLIVGATQILIYLAYFQPLGTHNIAWVLSFPKIILFSFVTMIIAASGYLINDYFDFETDRINEKKFKLNRAQNLKAYSFLCLIGFLLSLGFAISLNQVFLSLIFIGAVFLLFMYSYLWKKRVLIGNIVVSLFSAFVILILLYAEREALILLQNEDLLQFDKLIVQFLFFSIFAFLISLAREIIKDIEDVKGDSSLGYSTMPIKSGIPRTKLAVVFTLFVLLINIAFWIYKMSSGVNWFLLIYSLIFLAFPIVYLIKELTSRKTKNDFNHQSKLCKLIMVFGLILFIIYPWI